MRPNGRSAPARTASLPLLVALALAAAACTMPLEIRPLASIDGEPWQGAQADPYERAKHFLRDGRPGPAIQQFRAALAAQPGSIMALNGLAIAYDDLGRPDLAERYFHRALALRPDSAETLNNLGYSALRRGQVERARRAFEQARTLAPEDTVVLANLDLIQRSESPSSLTAAADNHRHGLTGLVARIDPETQMLFTRPDPELEALALDHGVEPALFVLAPR